MNMSVIKKLQEKFGDHFHTEPTFREQYCQAPTGITRSPPDGVVIVRNEQDIVDIVTFCSVEGLPMIPSGARTSIEGQINAPQGGICIDCSEMNAITDISIEDMTATIQPGVTREQLNEALRGTGLFFSVDPGANASIGGMAATRASGTNSVRYGTMATNVRAARLVMVDGSIANIGSRAVKSAMGLDLLSLAVGSEGTLGIFSELTVKLHPLPEVILSGVCAFDSVENAVRAVTDTLKSALPIARIELLNVSAVRACNAYSKLGLSEKPHLFVELHVNSLSMPGNIALFEEHVHRYGGEVQLSSHPEEREALWLARHDAWWAFHAFYEGCQGIPTDICVPLSCLSACITATETDIANTGLKAPLIGHVGDGNFHLLLMLREGEEETPVIQGFLSRLAERALSYGGTISGEHGVGQGKIKWMSVQHGAALHLMKAIKSALDPHNIMNPAKCIERIQQNYSGYTKTGIFSMQYILIVGINKISVKYISDAIRNAGHDLILSIDKSALCGDALQAISDVQCIPLFSDHNALSDYLNAHPDVTQNIHSITTFFDELFPMVNKIAEEFNFRGPPSVFAELASKYAVGKIVPEHVPEEVQISFSEDKFVLPWLKVRENNTIILKPAIGSGALATSTLHIEADRDPTHTIKSAIIASGAKSCETLPWIIQEYCSGTLVSMEGFVQGGKTIYLGLSRRERVRFTEVANHFPTDCGIEPIVHAKIQAAIHDLVLRSGFDNGFFHCEFIATDTTAYLIDANMGRLGGATIVEQVALAYGYSPSSVLQHAALLPLGLAESVPAYDQAAQINNTLSYWYGLAEESVIRGWDFPAISSIHTPIASPGSRIQPVGVSDYSWVGMLTGYTDIVQQEINLIRVKTDHGDRVPVFK